MRMAPSSIAANPDPNNNPNPSPILTPFTKAHKRMIKYIEQLIYTYRSN